MNIAVLTLRGSRYGLYVLNALKREGMAVDTVVVLDDPLRRRLRLLRRVAAKVGWRDAVVTAVVRQIGEIRERRTRAWRGESLQTDYGRLTSNVVRVASLRDRRVTRELRDRAIDIVLLGQSGIVPADVLVVPRVATLNAHPGWLPDYRGIDCHLWALHRHDFDRLGSTLHVVDAGIDTGGVVARRAFQWTAGETAEDIERDLREDCIDLLLDGVRLAEAGELTATPQPEGRYFHKFPRREMSAVRRNLELHMATVARDGASPYRQRSSRSPSGT
jgi:methionyl-tRNA formyltransferase